MRRAARWALVVVTFVVALFAAGAWLVATAPGLRALASLAAPLSGGRLVVEGARGALAGPFELARARLDSPTRRIELEGVHVAWRPRALAQGLVDIDLVAVRALRITELQPDLKPPELPASLRLPLDVRVKAVDVARIEYTGLAGTTYAFTGLRGGLDGQGSQWRLRDATLGTPWGRADGAGQLGKDAPFALAAQVTAAGRASVRARATLAGTLAAPRFDLAADADGLQLIARGEAAPFAPVKLVRLLVVGEGIDPRRFDPAAPDALLAFSGVFEGRPGERVFGNFSLVNARPGRLDQQRLPLAQLAGAVLGDAGHADFSHLAVDLGAVGKLAGTGRWRDGRFALQFDGTRLDLAGLHRDLAATRLAAQLELAGDAERQTLAGSVRESWGQGRFTLVHADRVLALTEADFAGAAGRLIAHGTAKLDATRAFAFNFDARNLNPARFGAFPRGRLNARGEASGAFAPAFRLAATLTLPPGELEGRPVRGQATLDYADAHLARADADLDLAGNRIRINGAWGRAGDRLGWDIDAPALARLNLGLAGRLVSTGTLTGSAAAPEIDARAAASGLRLPGDIAIAALDARLKLVATGEGAFDGALDARSLQLAGQSVDSVRASLAGRRDAHTLTLDARRADWRVTASLAGGLDAAHTWRGELKSADVAGPWPMRLLVPAPLVLARERQQVNALAFTLAGGRVDLAEVRRDGAAFASRGALVNLPLAPLLALVDPPPPVSTDLRVNADWNLKLGATLEGEARLARASGDARLSDPALALGLTRLDASLRASANQAQLRAEIDTREAGQARFEARVPLVVEAGVPALSRSAPLDWTARLDVPDLRRAKPFLPVGMRLDARLAANLAGSGSLAAPQVRGDLVADGIRFALPEEGVAIVDGRLDLALDGDRVRVRAGELRGQSGHINVRGEADWRNPRAGLTLDFAQFAATRRSDRQIVVSGTTQLAFAERRLKLSGKLVADRARLEMPEASRPQLSGDVIVTGQPPREPPAAQRFPLALDLVLGLGDDFLFKGGGLDARLGGQLRVFTVNDALRGEGTIQVTKGRYAAYAQTLDITRGVLRFAGPVDNPGLDVLAVRKTPAVTAGVQVRGTVQRPVVTLYSDPPMPDTEKLSWLVLGHGLDNAAQQEFVLLQVAAGALLSQAESVNFQTQLAERLHIDSFDVRAGSGENLGSAIVSVGKRVSSRATLSYEQSLDGLSQVVKVIYQLSPRVRLEAQAGQQSSFDAFYTREYD